MMKKRLVFISIFLSFALIGCNGNNTPSNPDNPPAPPVIYQTLNVDLCQEEVKNYLLAETETEQFQALYNHSTINPFDYKDSPHLPSVTFNISKNLPYSFIYTDDNWNTVHSETIYSSSYTFNSPIPGCSYQWEANDSKNVLVGHGVVNINDDVSVRYMKVDGATNIRDEGGWIGEDNHQVQYNLLYRGGQLNGNNTLTSKGLNFIRNTMGIKTEIDFRYDEDDSGQKVTAIGEKTFGGYDVAYLRDFENAFQNYGNFYKNKNTRAMINKIINAMSDIKNYPIYFHCIAGADRTGTFAFMINGLLGVSEEDLTRDFELTSFSPHGPRWRAAENADHSGFDYSKAKDGYTFQDMLNTLRSYGTKTDSIQQCVVNFLTKPNDNSSTGGCGLSIDLLNKVKVILLGLERDYLDPRNVDETCEKDGVAVHHLSGLDIVLQVDKLGHNYEINGNHGYCARCNKSVDVIDLEVDVKSGYNFGSDKIKATFTNGLELNLNNGFATFDKTLAYDKKIGLIVTDNTNAETYYNLSIYSSFINNEEDLLTMNLYEYDVLSFTGEIKTYGYYKMLNSIDMVNPWKNAYSLGLHSGQSSKGGFNGVFNGNECHITNFNCIDQDAALIYNMGKDGKVQNLILSGSTINSLLGSDFVTAYSYGGTYEHLSINVALADGDLIYNNTALLGTIGYKDDLVNPIKIFNVDLECLNARGILFSSALGQVYFSSQCEGKINNNIYLENVRIHSFTNLLIYANNKSASYNIAKTESELASVIGSSNMINVLIN